MRTGGPAEDRWEINFGNRLLAVKAYFECEVGVCNEKMSVKRCEYFSEQVSFDTSNNIRRMGLFAPNGACSGSRDRKRHDIRSLDSSQWGMLTVT